jgi:hypothetical protein
MAELRKARKVNADAMDRTKMGVARPRPAQAESEVEGQQRRVDMFSTACPYCGAVLSEDASSVQYEWFTCGICGGAFQA